MRTGVGRWQAAAGLPASSLPPAAPAPATHLSSHLAPQLLLILAQVVPARLRRSPCGGAQHGGAGRQSSRWIATRLRAAEMWVAGRGAGGSQALPALPASQPAGRSHREGRLAQLHAADGARAGHILQRQPQVAAGCGSGSRRMDEAGAQGIRSRGAGEMCVDGWFASVPCTAHSCNLPSALPGTRPRPSHLRRGRCRCRRRCRRARGTPPGASGCPPRLGPGWPASAGRPGSAG